MKDGLFHAKYLALLVALCLGACSSFDLAGARVRLTTVGDSCQATLSLRSGQIMPLKAPQRWCDTIPDGSLEFTLPGGDEDDSLETPTPITGE